MSLLKLLLRKTPQTRRFAARADELFAVPCTDRFFMTWLSPLSQFGRRELLVLESLFRWHRGGCLLVASDTMDSAGGRDKLRPFLERGFRLAVASPDFAYLLNGTPAEAWLSAVQRGGVSLGSVPLGQNLSNLLRLALLYRYGGIYLDADVVVLRPLSDLRNAIGAQAVDEATGDWRRLNNAVMVFDRAHPLLHEFIAEFAAAFDGSKWGHNGPYLVSRVAARLRHGSPDLAFTVLPLRAFYPVHWSKIGGLFVAPKDRKDKRWVKAKVENIKGESFGIHLWNRESSRLEVVDGGKASRGRRSSRAPLVPRATSAATAGARAALSRRLPPTRARGAAALHPLRLPRGEASLAPAASMAKASPTAPPSPVNSAAPPSFSSSDPAGELQNDSVRLPSSAGTPPS